MYWLDRKDHKEKFKKWRSLDYNYITFNISDKQEVKDIEMCFKSNLQKDFLIGVATLDYEQINTKFDILQSLVDDLGGKSKFINFYSVLNNLGKSDNVYNIHLEVGTHIKGETHIDDVSQNPQIESISILQLKEESIHDFLEEFICDLKKFTGNVPFLFLIKIHEENHSDLKDFKYWIKEKFVKKMNVLPNVKIVILYKGKSDEMLKSEYHIDIDESIGYTDIYEIIKLYIINYQKIPLTNDEIVARIDESASWIIFSDGKVSNNVIYGAVSRIFHAKFKSDSDHEKICLMKK